MPQLLPEVPGADPHRDHYLDEGPTRLDITQWAGICRCGQEFRGTTAEDIYAKAQLHINRHTCWMCHGWGLLDKQQTDETSWSNRTGSERGERFPIFRLLPAFGTHDGDLIPCPFCNGKGEL